MNFRGRYIFWLALLFIVAGAYCSNALTAGNAVGGGFAVLPADTAENEVRSADKPAFPVAATVPENIKDIETVYPVDLHTPENLDTSFVYNPLTNRYEYRTTIGGELIATPVSLTPDEYYSFSMKKSMNSYYMERYRADFDSISGKTSEKGNSFFDLKFDLGPAEKLFGPGGVKLDASGSVLVKMGISRTVNGNPTLTERQRKRTAFDFDTQINSDVKASIGDKLNFNLDYNTESTYDFDQKKLKLGYQGKEDEIIKTLEAGNVSMNTSNSLIRGGAALFGIKTELQFGKLTVGAIFSQQESESRTVSQRGNVQTTPFEIGIDNYEENMHFFLAQHFYENYDDNMSTLPLIKGGINIDRIEVWITNHRSDYSEARNIVAFADLGERNKISNTAFVQSNGSSPNIPHNGGNNLYNNLVNTYSQLRDVSQVNQVFAGTVMEGGSDYEKIENARRLTSSEYTLNSQLGYISLTYPLQSDEVLAVAFSFMYNGKSYQVGEFSTDNPSGTGGCLFLKLLKGTSFSPAAPTWRLMMKNVYSITEYNRPLESDKFRFDIKYKNDTTGIYLNYITEGAIANQVLIRVENLDRLDSRNEPFADGFFDFVNGFTVDASRGKIIFPSAEPFGSYLRKKIGNDAIADKYVFEELYDSTLTVARQTAEKNKFILSGEYKGSSASNYGYGAVGSRTTTVTANGVRLREGSDYILNNGQVEIINPAYENANIQMSYEDNSGFNTQRKTMMGLNLNYAINPKFNIGATVMNLSEMPMTMKVEPGMESINNTLFGFNINYATQSQLLTNLIDKLPLIDATQPSQITLTAEYARLSPDHYKSKYGGNYSYLDDFEAAKKTVDLRSPYSWNLASTPSMFPESKKTNDIDYGKNRALLAWYYIDALFSRESSLTPTHIKNDRDQRSNHYVRAVKETELFPERDRSFTQSSILPVLNIAYYPAERGPYNLDAKGMNPDGTLSNPQNRWGGITREIKSGQVDFEANNIETIEFWLLDPFIYNKNSQGGDLYINLGEISEDVLKDEKKFFENGLPIDGDTTKIEKTVWGVVPRQQSLVYAFDNSEGARKLQDVGLNGLSTEDEFNYPTYKNYLEELKKILLPATQEAMAADPFSPFNDPAGDNYHYFRGKDYDDRRLSILERYKHYNGLEGNSADASQTDENFNSAYRLTPDVEDINQDNTLNETEKYFQYKISIKPSDLNLNNKWIIQSKEVSPTLDNGKSEPVTWYQFKIPISEFTDKVGNINDFKSIRFMRMFLTNFSDSVVLRFGTFELVYGDWRTYAKDLSNPALPPAGNTAVSMSFVNYEEHSSKQPVNYIMPAGVNRIIDPGQTQLRQENEQSLMLKISGLDPGDARAIYKSSGMDTRQYRRLQMFTHAEKLIADNTNLQDYELSVFLRLGSDYTNNYYEYEVPLKLTPHGSYIETGEQQRIVWPDENMIDFPLELLTDLKLERNREKRKAGSTVNYFTPYSIFDPSKPMNKVSIVGNPTLSDVKVIMLGVRNNSLGSKSAELWFNELRLTDFNEDGGWAGNANLFVGLSDLGSVTFAGRKETAGFGSLDQGIMDRNIDDMHQYSLAAQVDLGRFFPEQAKVSLPLYYSYSQNVISPKYNPVDQDILMSDALNNVETAAEKDSIRSFAVDRETVRSINLNNMKINVQSKKPMPYDPANFTFGFSSTENKSQNASTQYETVSEKNLTADYSYSTPFKPWKPFVKKSNKGNAKNTSQQSATPKSATGKPSVWKPFLDNIEIGFLPSSLQVFSEIYRNYSEMQLRDIGNTTGINQIPVSFREEFYWNRKLETAWRLTKNLNFTFQSGTNARIETPHEQVNRILNPDQYEVWKDSVLAAIRNLGNPVEYRQNFNGSYKLPFSVVPPLNFIDNGNLTYKTDYSWDRGATLADPDLNLGNTIRNNRTLSLDNLSFNFVKLYSKSPFLDEANKKFTKKNPIVPRSSNRNTPNRQQNNPTQKTSKTSKRYEGTVALNTDSTTVFKHNLNTRRIRLTAKNENGKSYPLKYKSTDNNTIEIKNLDSVKLKVVASALPPLSDENWYKIAQGAARGLMLIRSIGITYSESNEFMVPNFDPEIGDFFGQGGSDFGLSPGLDFAFGLVDEDYVKRADRNGWLVKSGDNITPSMYSKIHTFNITAKLEPFPGMSISLTGLHSKTNRSETYFMYSGMPQKFSGDFTMTTVAIGSAFETSSASNNYYSKAFTRFLSNRSIIAARLESKYAGITYPNAGFMENDPSVAGQVYNPALGAVDRNSTDVLIPAFIAAYTGKDANSVGLSAFPSLKSLIPNWNVTFDGLMQIPFISQHFSSLSIEHVYKCTYSVGAFNSYLNWVEAGDDGTGFVENVQNGRPVPSSAYDITSVSIAENFRPFVGLKSMLKNNTGFSLLYNTSRKIDLNAAAYQIVETKQKDFTFETNYRFNNFNRVLKIRKTGGDNFNNELNVKLKVSYTMTHNLIRKIEEQITQATSGNSQFGVSFTADYNLSKMITLQAFYDRQSSRPLVSATAYPTSKSNFGISLRVSLQR
jgi:cell surface protein SprA